MPLYSTAQWRTLLADFLARREWLHIRWTHEINRCQVPGNRYLHLTEYNLSRWLNHTAETHGYRGPKSREDYVDIAHALLQLGVINAAEAREWLLVQGLYPLPHETLLLEAENTSEACFPMITQPHLPKTGK